MLKRLPLLLAMLLPIGSHAGWIDPGGKQLPDNESMRSSGAFGVQLVLTPDDQQFRRAWKEQAPPRLASTNRVQPGSSVSAMLVFHGCSPSPTGACDVVAEFVLESPDGARTPAGGGPVWSSAPARTGLMQLGLASITVGFGRSDPVGDYKVVANVTDKVSGRTLSVAGRFKVTN
jgi:hypothetical protein